MSAVDEGGRLSVKWLLQALGWVPGDRLEAHVRGPVIAMGPSGSARIRLPRDHTVRIPALLCRAAGLRGGDRVLVTADTGHNRLIVFPQHVLDAMVIRQLTDENGATK
ncbi:hypothetical protein [Nocardia huaxiensis]|uniref:SpoVT-AbrB domain-containing protein n=1 Tax=Nocardia huaxiensis TaxID=2755382 RepID=A0A7D6V8C7_9NOCA|nr:hypothetical protein [Nocardia huaxiensis]QLY28811.1 hypothetical protein H0264_26240 [Nocardia huaxiensis]UFS97712.1 hypothetical protein LPY97_07360 [Nocardia huaxiensis]